MLIEEQDNLYQYNLFAYCFNNVINLKDDSGFGAEQILIKNAVPLIKKLVPSLKKSATKAIDKIKTLLKKGNKNAKIYWGNFNDYKKVKLNGQEYAKVGNRLYSRHAIDRMQPSGNRYGSSIYQAGGDYGRSVSPQYVEDVINSAKPVLQENGNLSYINGTLQVITNRQGAVVTIIIK